MYIQLRDYCENAVLALQVAAFNCMARVRVIYGRVGGVTVQ